MAALTKAIEDEVIPRLMDARRADADALSRPAPAWQADSGQIDHFVRLLLDRDETLAVAHLRSLLDSGVRHETIYAALMTQAAHRLGAMWDEDEVNFTAVTTAVWRMQQMLHSMSKAFVGAAETPARGKRVLLVPAIGGQHSFGLAIVSEFFRKAGWEVCSEVVHGNADLEALLRDSWFDVVGFSVGGENQLAAVTTSIRLARKASRNLRLGVMVGGPVFVAQPGLVGDVGADATAADAPQSIVEAERLLLLLATTG